MKLKFEAIKVSCVDAIHGEILSVRFDSVGADHGEEERRKPYVLIMRSFEFPGAATIEWHDGTDYDGGADIIGVTLKRTQVLIALSEGINIDVTYKINGKQFEQLKSYLSRMLDGRLSCEAGLV